MYRILENFDERDENLSGRVIIYYMLLFIIVIIKYCRRVADQILDLCYIFLTMGNTREIPLYVVCLQYLTNERQHVSRRGGSEISPLTFAFGVVDISHWAGGLAFLTRDRKGASSNERLPALRHSLYICANIRRYLIFTEMPAFEMHIEIK